MKSESLPGEILDCDMSMAMAIRAAIADKSESLPGEILDCDSYYKSQDSKKKEDRQNHFQARYWIATQLY